jgi:hypothetical protein
VKKWGEIKERLCTIDTGAVSSRDHHEHIRASDMLAAPADQVADRAA